MKKRDLYILRGKDKEKGRERDNKKEWDNIYMIYVDYITFMKSRYLGQVWLGYNGFWLLGWPAGLGIKDKEAQQGTGPRYGLVIAK